MTRHPFTYLSILLAFILFLVGNGNLHLFDWDEINFASCAREMLITGNFAFPTIAFQPFYEKPPLFFWLQSICMRVFGINEFSARMPNAFAGLLTLLLLFHYGKKYFFNQKGFIWPMMFGAGVLPFLYFKSGIIDPWFNLFMFLSIIEYYLYIKKKKLLHFISSSLFLSFAVLTKGPVAILIVSFTVMATEFYVYGNIVLSVLNAVKHLFPALSIIGIYIIILWKSGNGKFLKEFISYQVRLFSQEDSGHGGPFWYHIPILWLGCFPASILAVPRIYHLNKSDNRIFSFMMAVSLIWVLFIFSVVKTKIVHYSSFCYYSISFLATDYICSNLAHGKPVPNIIRFFLILTSLLILTSINSAYLIKVFLNRYSYLIKDDIILSNMHFLGSDNYIMFSISLFFSLAFLACLLIIKTNWSVVLISGISIVLIFFTSLISNLYKVEILSQKGLIEIFKIIHKFDAYTETANFKSYAYFFYGERLPVHYSRQEIKIPLSEIRDEFPTFNSKYHHILINSRLSKPVILVYKGYQPDVFKEYYSNFKALRTKFGYSILLKLPEN
ncbi:MAG: glycosyltransferase family 39 protein [Bacteroidia bacterium]|nr:glycosyltransferase family 39 protein [Bacteroidia bacterium]